MAESGGARRGMHAAQAGGWHPSGRGDLADALERLPAPCAGRVPSRKLLPEAASPSDGASWMRFATIDFVIALKCCTTAGKRMLRHALGKRLGRYDAHRVHETKTRYVDFRSAGVPCGQTISLDGVGTRQDYPELPAASPTSGGGRVQGKDARSPNHQRRARFRPRAEIGARLVQETPAPADRGAAWITLASSVIRQPSAHQAMV